jgi:Uma2 family endonuclease
VDRHPLRRRPRDHVTRAIVAGRRRRELFTQQEYHRWLGDVPPSDVHHYELVNGRIVMSPPSDFRHGAVEANLHSWLATHVRELRLGVTLGSSAGYDMPTGDTLRPDFSFISSERLVAGPKPRDRDESFTRIVPDLVAEILAPSSMRRDRIEKRLIYARCGVREYWLIDPAEREVLVFASLGDRFDEPRVLTRGSLRSSVLPALQVTVEDLLAVPS